MPRRLKVFRMPIGFEDAYVAAPSRKAALLAWGATHDQFARGVAEEVTDPALTAEPLAHPGEVIRKSRGDLASQLKALPKAPADPKKPAGKSAPQPPPKPIKPAPPPSRAKLDRAEAALAKAQAAQQAEREVLEQQLAALQSRHERALAKLTAARDAARGAFRDALEAWGG